MIMDGTIQKVATLQFGHGGEPWRTGTSGKITSNLQCFNSATAVNRGERISDPVPVSLSGLQFGHGGEPWRTGLKIE